ncbi:MAG: hypothetical protein P8J14_06250, partial [Emcibacteraceae bacterium]|nr:hypothetical protein [Emcibacteraceae bacterium]
MKKTSNYPLGRYHELIDQGKLKEDDLQAAVVDKIQALFLVLKDKAEKKDNGLLSKLFSKK